MIEPDLMEKVVAPKHYGPIFKQHTIGCDFFVGMLPFWLGMAFKYIWRAGRKEGASMRLDINKASECMRKWKMSSYAWEALEDAYPGQTRLMLLFREVFTLEADDPKEQWRLDALWNVLRGDEERVDEYLMDKLDEIEQCVRSKK